VNTGYKRGFIMSSGSFFGKIFRAMGRALDWLTGSDDEKLRAARSRGQYSGGNVEIEQDEIKGEEKIRSEEERYSTEFDVWEEIDSYRMTFWFGSKMARYMTKSKKREEKLRKELEELDRRREEEKRQKGEG
jgi:hypothetical protein